MKYFVEPQCSKQKKAIAVLIEVGSVVNRSSVFTNQVTHLKNVFRILSLCLQMRILIIHLHRENVLPPTIFLNFDDGGYSFVADTVGGLFFVNSISHFSLSLNFLLLAELCFCFMVSFSCLRKMSFFPAPKDK